MTDWLLVLGAHAGEIVSSTLEGQLGTIKAASKPKIGWELDAAAGQDILTSNCGSTTIALTGSVIAPTSPIDKMASSIKATFTAKDGKQNPESFEDAPKQLLSLLTQSGEEQAGLTLSAVLGNEEAIEIKAVG